MIRWAYNPMSAKIPWQLVTLQLHCLADCEIWHCCALRCAAVAGKRPKAKISQLTFVCVFLCSSPLQMVQHPRRRSAILEGNASSEEAEDQGSPTGSGDVTAEPSELSMADSVSSEPWVLTLFTLVSVVNLVITSCTHRCILFVLYGCFCVFPPSYLRNRTR